jgi:hypothetical protein
VIWLWFVLGDGLVLTLRNAGRVQLVIDTGAGAHRDPYARCGPAVAIGVPWLWSTRGQEGRPAVTVDALPSEREAVGVPSVSVARGTLR